MTAYPKSTEPCGSLEQTVRGLDPTPETVLVFEFVGSLMAAAFDQSNFFRIDRDGTEAVLQFLRTTGEQWTGPTDFRKLENLDLTGVLIVMGAMRDLAPRTNGALGMGFHQTIGSDVGSHPDLKIRRRQHLRIDLILRTFSRSRRDQINSLFAAQAVIVVPTIGRVRQHLLR